MKTYIPIAPCTTNIPPKDDIDARKKRAFTLIECSRICPFRWMRSLYFCFLCDQKYTDPQELREHYSKHPNVTRAQMKNAKKMKKYALIKVDITDVGCKLCDDVISNFDDLKRHLVNKHKKDIDMKSNGVLPVRITRDSFKCTLCDKQYVEFKTLLQHMNAHFQNFICDQCGAGFMTPDRLRVHSFSHETGTFKCDADGCDKTFRSSLAKNNHYAVIHLKMKRHRCPQCSETFINYFQRSKHVSAVHGVKLKEFKCNLCPKVFTLSGKLIDHVNSAHLKIRRFSCDVCSFKSYSKSKLRQHMVIHAGKRKFECNVCNKTYVRDYALREHMTLHDNGKRFDCIECGQSFGQLHRLKRHLNTRHTNSAKNGSAVE